MITTALTFMAMPVISSPGRPAANFDGQKYFVLFDLLPVAFFPGFLLATVTLHLAKFIGKWHGHFAKFMLVGE